MTKDDAKQAMLEGKKETHDYFSPNEWATMQGNEVVLEDGVHCSEDEFWKYRSAKYFEYGWSIYGAE